MKDIMGKRKTEAHNNNNNNNNNNIHRYILYDVVFGLLSL